jgi:hypothetical protein
MSEIDVLCRVVRVHKMARRGMTQLRQVTVETYTAVRVPVTCPPDQSSFGCPCAWLSAVETDSVSCRQMALAVLLKGLVLN